MRDGAAYGLKLYAIQACSLLARLGLQNGDTIEAIDGAPLTTPDQVLAAYARLHEPAAHAVRLPRRGESVELEVRVE